MGLRTSLDKFRNAGLAWSSRAICTRVARKIQTTRAVRDRLDRRWLITQDVLLNAIDFGDAATGDYAGCFIDRAVAKHFLDNADKTADIARTQFPDAVKYTIAQADAFCRHAFHFLGRDIQFDGPIDWFWMPDTDKRWPFIHAEDFPKGFYNSPSRPGDLKYPWELCRHQYFVTLGKAYRYTLDEKYAEAFTDQLLDWIARNPFRSGIHWTSEMEFGIRILSWINAFWLFKDSPYFRTKGLVPFLQSLYQHAHYLRRRLTTGWLAANNHLLGETAGLFAFGVLFPQFKDAAEYRNDALRIFTDALERQICSDGVNREQATGYHRFVVDFIWIIVRLGELNGVSVPRVVGERLERMLDYEAALMPPNGAVPQVGDCDDGRGFWLSESVPFFDYRGWLTAGALQFNRADFMRAAEGGNEEALWFMGVDSWNQLQKVPVDTAPRKSVHFPEGGHCVLRTGDAEDDTYIFVRCGEFGLGQDGSSAHSHGDILAPVVIWQGQPLFVDAGTHHYYGPTEERDAFRSVAVHNNLSPIGVEMAKMFAIWNWGAVPQSEITRFDSNAASTTMEGSCVSFAGYTHRRRITLTHGPVAVVIDDELILNDALRGTPVEMRWLLATGLDARVVGDAGCMIYRNELPIARIQFDGVAQITVKDAQYSPSYGTVLQTKRIHATLRGQHASTRVDMHF